MDGKPQVNVGSDRHNLTHGAESSKEINAQPMLPWVPCPTRLAPQADNQLDQYQLLSKLVLGRKSFYKTRFQVGMYLKKVQKQGRDEKTQKHYPTFAKIHSRCRVVFLRSFISTSFLYYFQVHPYSKTFFPTFCSLGRWFLNQLQNRRRTRLSLATR